MARRLVSLQRFMLAPGDRIHAGYGFVVEILDVVRSGDEYNRVYASTLVVINGGEAGISPGLMFRHHLKGTYMVDTANVFNSDGVPG